MSEEERGGPKPKPKGSLVKNPSTPGIQRPNTPTGRERPDQDQEKRR